MNDIDWINELDKHDGFCVIKFVDNAQYFCRIVRDGVLTFGGGLTLDEAIYDARRRELTGSEFHQTVLNYETPLLPCPFCNDPNPKVEKINRIGVHAEKYWYVVVCSVDHCDVMGPSRNTEAEAMAAWNNRMAIAKKGE
jgi:Lar family restriction alleviation protein